jgi:hypothetical protein
MYIVQSVYVYLSSYKSQYVDIITRKGVKNRQPINGLSSGWSEVTSQANKIDFVFKLKTKNMVMRLNTDSKQIPKDLPTVSQRDWEFGLVFERVRGRDSSVGIATSYGLDGPGIESQWGRDFSHTSRPALRPTQPPVQWVPGLSRGYGGRGVVVTTHPLPAPKSRKSRAIPLPISGPSGLLRGTFTLPLKGLGENLKTDIAPALLTTLILSILCSTLHIWHLIQK